MTDGKSAWRGLVDSGAAKCPLLSAALRRAGRIWTSSKPTFEAVSTIDLRALAAFRISLALLLVYDLIARWREIEVFYAPGGTFPLGSAFGPTRFPQPTLLSLPPDNLSLQATFAAFLAVFLMFGIGLWMRFAKAASFVVLVSLLNRNPMVIDGGDVVRMTLLTWSLLLPLDARFSVSAWLRRRRAAVAGEVSASTPPDVYVSVATFGIRMQIGLIYLFAALSKWGGTWRDGSAIHYALQLRELTTPLGLWLSTLPVPVLQAFTHATWFTEFCAIFLLMAPLGQPWLRRVAVLSLIILHVGIALTMRLAIFEATMIAACLLFMGPEEWDVLSRRRPVRSDADTGRRTAPLSGDRQAWQLAKGIIAVMLLCLVTIDGYNVNVATKPDGMPRLDRPWAMRAFLEVPRLVQDWRLFAPNPYGATGYWMADGYTADGRQLQVLGDGDPQRWVSQNSRFWYKYLTRLLEPQNEALRVHLARFLVTQHNQVAGSADHIVRIAMFYVQEPSSPPGRRRGGPPRTTQLWPPIHSRETSREASEPDRLGNRP